MKQNWYEITSEDVLKALRTTTDGLSDSEVLLRQKADGPNSLPEPEVDSLALIFMRQFKSPLVYVLGIVSVIVLASGEYIDAAVIAFILLFNAVIGAIQEGRAQDTLAALKRFVRTQTLVRRNGKDEIIPDEELVVGDIVVLHEGDKVPADGRLIVSNNIDINESSLTGESGSVQKITEPLRSEAHGHAIYLPEQHNMVFKGTHVVAGVGEMVVTAIGVSTQIGLLSKTLSEESTEIPLQANMRNLSRAIMMIVAIASAALFGIGLLYDRPAVEMLKTVVSLAVSVIPEGLPVVMTLVLANGVWRMSQRKALVKKLAAVEALGQADVIAVDKTGTITKNELVVQSVLVKGRRFEVTGEGYEPKGDILLHKEAVSPLDVAELILAGRVAAFAGAELFYVPQLETWQIKGDPTEAALLVFAEKVGYKPEDMKLRHPIVQEIPFDYHAKYRAVVFHENSKLTAAFWGAPEAIGKLSGMDEAEVHRQVQPLVEDGLRVVAFAFARVTEMIDPKKIPPCTFGGYIGMRDTLHPEVNSAVSKVQEAGIRTVMITGDHKLTAQSIAEAAGIFKPGDTVITGPELEKMSDAQLATSIKTVSVFARVVPEFKLRIVKAFQANGSTIAMTGDGVNDVPSIVAADLGIAMGRAGTEVTKEAADIILLDDNFTTIVAAVEEGRNIYKTIQRALLYLFSTSLGEFFTVAIALLIGLPLPVIAVQILWLNFVTDGFLTIAFAMEPKEGNLMQGKFKKPNKYLVDKSMIIRMVIMGAVMSAGTLILFNAYKEGDYVKATTMALTVLAVFQWFNAWNCRSEKQSAFKGLTSNPWLLLATGIVVILQIAAVHLEPLQRVLKTTALSPREWGITVAVASSVIIMEELRKQITKLIKK